jgi:hypothetical protein
LEHGRTTWPKMTNRQRLYREGFSRGTRRQEGRTRGPAGAPNPPGRRIVAHLSPCPAFRGTAATDDACE